MVSKNRTISFPALLSFHTVARLGGVTAAANHLGVAKSGVSRHLAQLEDYFDVKLLERGARSVKLTPIGATLNQRIRSILAEIDLLEDIAREESGGVSGQVTVATTPEFAGIVTSALFAAARIRHPGLTFVFRPAYEFEDMQDPETDLAFRIGSFVDDRLVAIQLGEVHFCLVAAPSVVERHPIGCPEDIPNAPCLTFQGTQANTIWTFIKGEEPTQIEVKGKIAVHSFAVLFDLAVAGHGYAFLPKFLLHEAIKSGALIPRLTDWNSRDYSVFLTFRPGARRIARIDAALTLAEELIPPILSELDVLK